MLTTYMMMAKSIAQVLLIASMILIVTASNNAPRAQTQQGIYIGRQTTIHDTNVNYWGGIPYVQQPVGNLRWKPPQPLLFSNDINFAYMPNACPQGSGVDPPFTEACLTLNVHAPENANNLPVYVWIHGGGFTGGSGMGYNATPFVSASINHSVPVVVVTINYRLGLLGFLADQALYDEKTGINNRSTTGNYGMLDQMMALDWIKKNIRGFGGNPEQITIGGESAGGISVTILLTSPLVKNGTFQRAIIQSGSIWPNAVSTIENAINNSGSSLRSAANCTTVECLRYLTVKEILKVQGTIAARNLFGVAARPVIDGYVLNDIMENNYARGNFQKVSVLVGSNTNETSLFTCPHFNGSATIDQVQEFFATIYNATIINKVPDIYGPISTYSNPLTYLNIVYSNSWAHCGSRRIAAKFSSHQVPSYLFTYNHLIPISKPCRGVAHAAELPMLFPSLLHAFFPDYNLTAEEQQLSTNMMLYWANFIRTSNPNFEGSLANWDAYSVISDNDFLLNIQPQMRNYYYNATCSRFWDLYAVTNSTSITPTIKYDNSYHSF